MPACDPCLNASMRTSKAAGKSGVVEQSDGSVNVIQLASRLRQQLIHRRHQSLDMVHTDLEVFAFLIGQIKFDNTFDAARP